jgi:glycosyltransferase involved in cell wall biosynthesis
MFLSRSAARPRHIRRRLLYVGQLTQLKGIIPFLDTCDRWCNEHPGERLEIRLVGDGDLRLELENRVTPLNMKLELEPAAQYKEMPEVYRSGGILVLPTLADTWALVVNEAMAAGLPVMGSVYSQAVDEMVIDGVNGWRFRSDDSADSYLTLCRVMDCAIEDLERMSERARETAAVIRPETVADLVAQAVADARRPRGAILTNMVAPYRIPLYDQIGRFFDLTVLTSRTEKTRSSWGNGRIAAKCFSVRQSLSVLLTFRQQSGERTFGYSSVQIPFGLLFDLIRMRPDWIISAEMGLRTLVALLYSTLTGTPHWVWWGGTTTTEAGVGIWRKLLRKFLVHRIKHWISYGLSSSGYLTSIGVRSSNILTIQNCCTPLEACVSTPRRPSSSGTTRFLAVGRLIGLKGFDVLIRGLARLQREGHDCTLRIVGSGPEKAALERLVLETGLSGSEFVGEYRAEDALRAYGDADCLVLPTFQDVWGLVVNEAIQAGVPVICSIHAGCVDELVPPEYCFDPHEERSLRQALLKVLLGEVKPIPKSVLRTPESVAQSIIEAIQGQLASESDKAA